MTGLIGGKRVPKTAQRIEAFGAVDELNAAIGVARAINAERSLPSVRQEIEEHLSRVQNKLFDIGSVLALAPKIKPLSRMPVGGKDVKRLEQAMDGWQKGLPALRSFVLPGGGLLPSALHVARTVCRRAEREVLRLAAKEATPDISVIYLNRLSDFLFVLSRWTAKNSGEPELLWDLPLKKTRASR